MSTIKEDILSRITDEQIVDIMIDLGSMSPVINQVNTNQMIFSCLCHGDVNKMKLYCFGGEEGHTFYCYVCDEYFSNIITLVEHVRNIEFVEALSYVKEMCGISTTYVERHMGFGGNESIGDWELLSKFNVRKKEIEQPNVVHNGVMDLFSDLYYNGWIRENISIETMKMFNIKYYIGENSIIIPHYNIDGELIGIRRRSLDEKVVERGFKYTPLQVGKKMYNHQLAHALYGLNINKETIKKTGKCLLVESEKSVMQVNSYYGDESFAVSCCGSSLSDVQASLLISLGVREIIVGFDRDYATESFSDNKYALFHKKVMRVYSKCSQYMNVFTIHDGMTELLDLKDSPTDKGKEVLEQLMKQKTYIEEEEDEY